MKKIFFLSILSFCFGFLQSCKDSSTEPVLSKKDLLTRTAWKLVEGDGEVGDVTKFFSDGTVWAESAEGQWRLSADGKFVVLTVPGEEEIQSEIIKLSTDTLELRTTIGPFVLRAKFVPEPNFSQTRYMLARTQWRFTTPGNLQGMKLSFTYKGELSLMLADTIGTGNYSLESDDKVLVTDPLINTDKMDIIELTKTTLILKTKSSTPQTYVLVADNSNSYVLNGTLDMRSMGTLPNDARLLVVWNISSGSPDYSYVWGEGAIDRVNNTFSIEFTDNPPDSALNINGQGKLGVGYVVVVTGFTRQSGIVNDNELEAKVIGAINNSAIIYSKGIMPNMPWVQFFDEGYGFGTGWDNPDAGFDGFTPGDSSNIILTIDEFKNFFFPNWT